MHLLGRTVLTIAFLLFTNISTAAEPPARIAWTGAGPAVSPVWVIQEKNLLKRQGLDAEVISVTASPTALQALLAGQVDMIVTSAATLVTSRLAGADVVMFLGIVPTFVEHIITLPSITRVEQLRGKIGGGNRPGSNSDLGLRLALRKLGINADKDLQIISTGSNPEKLAALSRGLVQFTIMPEPFVREAEKLGFNDLLDLSSLKIPFWWNGVLSRESIIRAKRPFLIKFARAMTEALHYLKTDREGSKAVFNKYLRLNDSEGLERAYRTYNAVFPEIPYPAIEGVKTLLDDLAVRDPRAANANPKSFVDTSIVQEVEASGFIKQLYKR